MVAKNKLDIKYSEDTRLALLEQSITHINETLKRFDKRFDDIDKRFDKLDVRIDSSFKWTLGLMYSSIVGILVLIGHQFHWF